MPISSPSGLRILDETGLVVAVPLAIEAQGPAAVGAYLASLAQPEPDTHETPVPDEAHPAPSDTPSTAE
jgi:hypothetical protein